MRCIICDKQIELLEGSSGNLKNAGMLKAYFGYGSDHDQLGAQGYLPEPVDRLTRLLRCDEVVAYICDSCFEKKIELFEGFDIKRSVRREKVEWQRGSSG